MIVVGDHLADAVAEPDALGARGSCGEEHLGGRAVRVFLQEMVLDRPGVVDADAVGELDLVERVLHQLPLVVGTPGLGQLQLVKDSEFHSDVSTRASPLQRPICLGAWQALVSSRRSSPGSIATIDVGASGSMDPGHKAAQGPG